jgi:ferritin
MVKIMSGSSTTRRFSGYKVVELTSLYPGPLTGRLLINWGFEVLKIEPPEGDPMRSLIPTLYDLLNEGKRIIYLDLKRDDDKQKFYEIVKDSNALVTSFRQTTLNRLGASYKRVSEVNPDIIYVMIRGYENSDAPGHDINFAALAGHLRDKPPIPQCIDVATGFLAAFAVAVSLATNRTGYIEVSMERVAYILNLLNYAQLIEGREPMLTGRYPFYNVYKCADGFIALGAVEKKFWDRFCDLLGRPDLRDKIFDPEAVVEIGKELSHESCAKLIEKARDMDIPLTMLRSPENIARSLDLRKLLSIEIIK